MSGSLEKEIFELLRTVTISPNDIGEVCKKIQAIIEAQRYEAYEMGYETGRDKGHDEGYEKGKREGHDDGYRNGLDDACERVSSNLTLEYDERNRLIRRIRG